MQINKKRSPIFAILTDVTLQIVAALILISQDYNSKWSAASQIAAEVPGLETRVEGLVGELEDADENLHRSQKEGAEKDGLIVARDKQIGYLVKEVGQLSEELARLTPAEAVEIVVLVDSTGSMKPHIERLKVALKSLFDWTPYLARECSIGVLGFRDGVVYEHPLSVVKPRYQDDGVSQSNLMAFMESIETQTSPAKPVFSKAIKMLPKPKSGTKQLILVLSDIVCSELDYVNGQPPGYSPRELALAEQISEDVQQWAATAKGRSVGAIYVGASNTFDHRWYQDITYPADENFSLHSEELFSVIMNSIRPTGASQ